MINPALWQAEQQRDLAPRVIIDDCTADDKFLEPEAVIRAPAGTSGVGIRFAALSFAYPEEIQYRYRLIGVSDDWIDGGPRSDAIFQNFAPGNYRFEVVASNRFGRWSDEPTSAELTILPQWWEHAEATTAAVEIKRGAAMLTSTVTDDGRGFDFRAQAQGVGLRSISERTQLMGGRWEVRAAPGGGTKVRVSIPLQVGN